MPAVSRERFLRWFAALADIGRTDTGWNRVAWTPLEVEAQEWFRREAEGIGLEVRKDGSGNMWAVTPGAGDGPYVCAGSHVDTQPDGGAYDGALGVVCALEAVAAILESGEPRSRPLAVISFVDEEGARFRNSCFGSLAVTGRLDIDAVLAAMGDAPAIHGVTRESLLESRDELRKIACFLEVHVEQGKALIDRGQVVGIADVLAPRSRFRAVFEGESNHAGTTPMAGRRDALVEAARFVLAVDEAARTRPNAVGTVGRVEISPGSTNSIPGRWRARSTPGRSCSRPSTTSSPTCARAFPARHLPRSPATPARASTRACAPPSTHRRRRRASARATCPPTPATTPASWHPTFRRR